MEHRYSARVAGEMKVLIYKADLPVAVGWLRNVSHNGLFIVSDLDDMPVNQCLEVEVLGDIELLDDSHHGDSHRRCRALVVHKSGQGFGLAIDENCSRSRALAIELVGRYRQRGAAIPAYSRSEEAEIDSTFYI